MRRPWPIYLVAFWCFIGLVLQCNSLLDALKARVIHDQIPNDIWKPLNGFIDILIIWHAFRVAQLKSFNRWFSVVFFLLWTLLSIVIASIRFQRYLTRRSFREFAVKYVTEHEQEKKLRDMQKFSQEQIRKGKV